MSFVDVEIPTQKKKRLEQSTPKSKREQHRKVTKEKLNHVPVFNATASANASAHAAVTFAPDERPNALNSLLFFPWMSTNTEYLIISDSDASDSDDSKNDQKGDAASTKKNENESNLIKADNQQTFFDKLSNITKDIGHFFTHPNANIRQFFRRREGYLPPDQRLIQETTSNEKQSEIN